MQKYNKMKKILLLAAVATMAAAANAQLRSDIVANDNETQQAVLVAPTTDCQMAGLNQTNKPSKAEGDVLKALYKRPAGTFYVPYYTREDQEGTWGYNSPSLHATAYVPMTTGCSTVKSTSFDSISSLLHPLVHHADHANWLAPVEALT